MIVINMGKYDLKLRPTYWASVSGGKDSLYMLNIILHNLDKYPLDGVVHFELEIDYPFIKNVIDYMENECKKHNIKFVRIKPRKSWYELYEKYGMPTRKARWCNSKYKLDSLKQLKEFMIKQGSYVVSYIGYCVDEVNRYEKRKENEIYPLVDFNISEDKILEWAKTVPLFNNYYKSNRRCGCMFCPMSSRINLAYLLKYYPEKYDELMKLSKDTEKTREKELGRCFSVRSSNPKYNTDYIDNNVRFKWLPKLEDIERTCQNITLNGVNRKEVQYDKG